MLVYTLAIVQYKNDCTLYNPHALEHAPCRIHKYEQHPQLATASLITTWRDMFLQISTTTIARIIREILDGAASKERKKNSQVETRMQVDVIANSHCGGWKYKGKQSCDFSTVQFRIFSNFLNSDPSRSKKNIIIIIIISIYVYKYITHMSKAVKK